MSESHTLPFLREALVFLTLSGILIPLLQRLRINQIVGFLAVGVLRVGDGAGRSAAAQKLGLEIVPVVVLDHLTPTQRRALVIADNRILVGGSTAGAVQIAANVTPMHFGGGVIRGKDAAIAGTLSRARVVTDYAFSA